METSCTYTTNIQPTGKTCPILQSVQDSKCSRRKVSIPLNTILIATKLKHSYLETLHRLKQLELDGIVERVDYYPSPYTILVALLPTPQLQKQWLRKHIALVYDPATGEVRHRTPRDFALWSIVEEEK